MGLLRGMVDGTTWRDELDAIGKEDSQWGRTKVSGRDIGM